MTTQAGKVTAVVMGSAVVFALGWWVCQSYFDLDTATSVAVATFAAGVIGAPLLIWANPSTPAPVVQPPLASSDTVVFEPVKVQPAPMPSADSMLRPAPTVRLDGPVSNLPKLPTRIFVGRQAELAALDATMREGIGVVSQTVQGLGGVGKSELALHYAHANRDRYQLVWWVTADSQAQVDAGLAALTHRLQPAAETTAEEAVKWARTWLQTHTDWLLVLDNVDHRGDIDELLAQLATGHVLITTRRQVGWERMVDNCIQLDVLEKEAAAALLMQQSGQSDRDAAEQLAAELGFLPLALEQAAAYLAQVKISMADYLRRIRDDEQSLSETAAGDDAALAVARVWQIGLASINRASIVAGDILSLLACFGPDNLPRDVLNGYGKQAEVDGALGLLRSYSMITLTGESVSVHRLVQAVVRQQAVNTAEGADLAKARTSAVELLLVALPAGNPQHVVSGWPRWLSLLPHVHAVLGRFPKDTGDLSLAQLLSATAVFLTAQGAYADALAYKQRALEINERLLGSDHPTVAAGLDSVGNSLRDLGRAQEAVALQRRALAITEHSRGEDDLEVAVRLNNLAGSLGDVGHTGEAISLLFRAVEITETQLGPSDLDVAVRLNNLAGALQTADRADEAEPLQRRALAITEGILDANHPDVATRLNNLAVSLKALGRTSEAIPLQERVLAITKEVLGPDHPRVAVAMNNLALSLLLEDRDDEAEPLQESALAIAQKSLGPDHPITRQLRANQGSLRHPTD